MSEKSKKLRVFAGPNGSGKTTIIKSLTEEKKINLGRYLNADDIEVILKQENEIKLSSYDVECSELQFQKFIENHSITKKLATNNLVLNLVFENNVIKHKTDQNFSYEASVIVDLIRQLLIEKGERLSFETVMSHESKIHVLQNAMELGYKNYLYFVSTEDVEINKNRVDNRVKDGGHNVPKEKIESRYDRSLKLLREAVKYTYRTFVYDNSGTEAKLILDIFKGNEVTIRASEIPSWVMNYLLK